MTPTILYAGAAKDRDAWRGALNDAARDAGLEINLICDPADIAADQVDYLLMDDIACIDDFSKYTKLRAILSLWAGVENHLARADLPRHVPLARMVEPGLSLGMANFVTAQALSLQLRLDRMRAASLAGEWDKFAPNLTSAACVGVLGLGMLGAETARMLSATGFKVVGWSRTPKRQEHVDSFHGAAQLPDFLRRSDILVILTPLTPETRGLINAERLAMLPRGAHVINVARGPIIVDDDLLTALDSGHIGAAVLDVFETEPLPIDHPYWWHPSVTVTPHLASVTRPDTASVEIVKQIRRHLNEEALLYVVDYERGY